MRNSLLIIIVAITLVACSPSRQNILTSPSPTVSATDTAPMATQPTSTLLSTEIPTFQLENVSSRVVSFSDLGLADTTRILVFDPKSEQVLSISDQSIDPIPNIQSGLYSLRDGIEMSPDHKWFAYLEINEGFNIQISSVDGTQHFIGIKNAVGSSFRWLSNDKIAVYNKLGFWADCPSELQIFNVFSKATNTIPDISSHGSQYCFPIPYFNSDFSQALYLNSETGWQVYDYKTQTSYSVLPGLDAGPGGDKYFFQWGTNGLSFAIPGTDKITFALAVSENELTSTAPLEVIALPKDTLNENRGLDVWFPAKHFVGFDLSAKNQNTVLNCNIPKTFVMIDLEAQTLKNYCLDRATFANQNCTAWFVYTSADSRFVGWTIRELPDNEEPLSTVILDTESGEVVYLEGYEFLGFGEISPQ